jgi:NADPH2:quinone reductase
MLYHQEMKKQRSTEMQAIQLHEHGGYDKLVASDIATPEPGKDEVRIKVMAAGLNYIDTYHRTGLYPVALPFTPGVEGAGVIDAVGPGVVGFSEGNRVAWAFHPGGYAEYAIVPAAKVVPVPDEIELQQAAAVMLQGMTAHYLTHSTFPVNPDDLVLVHAAAGGTGQLLVQMAKKRGGRVFGTVSSAEKGALAIQAGADEIILYEQKNFADEVQRLTNNRGVDVVYDSVGQATFEGSLDSLRPRGYLVLFGQSSGPVKPFDPAILNSKGSLFLTRPSLGHYVATRDELLERATDVLSGLAAGTLAAKIDRTVPLAEAAAAHEALESRATAGKVLLLP